MLKFDSERVREEYLDGDPNLPPRYLELILLRCALLAANEIFVKEWERLNTLRNCEDKVKYHEAQEAFESRWHILYPSGRHDLRNLPSFYVHVKSAEDLEEGKLVIEVDLNGPISRVCADVDSLISTWHKEFNRRIEEGDFYLDQIQDLKGKKVESRLGGNIKKKSSFDDYYLYLDIWRAKESGKNWKEVTKEFQLNIDEARNHHRSAERLIKQGVPGLPPFPK